MDAYSKRKYYFLGLFICISLILIVKLFIIQIIDPTYKVSANNNSMRRIIQYPSRGLIYDRNNKLLVYNRASFNLMLTPGQMTEFDTVDLCVILDIDINNLKHKIQEAKNYSLFKPSLLLSRISQKRMALLSEKLFKFPGFSVRTIPVREYPQKIASHILGYLGEVGKLEVQNSNIYESGDYIGISGIENVYEKELRGKKGYSIYQVDVHNRIIGPFNEGRYDTIAVEGNNIVCGIDSDLQEYGEKLIKNNRGSIVAIHPQTGEILTLISSPFYDPELFIGRQRTEKFTELVKDTLNPLFNRAIMSRYAPGSIFKIVQALIGLQIGVITENSGFPCDKFIMGCHDHPDPTSLKKAIQYSCNPYFYEVYKRIIQQGEKDDIFKDSEYGLEIWQNFVSNFGFGQLLNIDLPNERTGVVPNAELYNNWYGRYSWAFSTIYSNSNGQGELETTPLQIANLAATIANRGYYYTPHIVRSVGDNISPKNLYSEKIQTNIDINYYETIIQSMYDVVWADKGTGANARVPGISVCGKTGTVENVHGENHSGFFAFAPMENPQIAVSVYIENAGEGANMAALICSLILEKYLTREVKQLYKEKLILNLNSEIN